MANSIIGRTNPATPKGASMPFGPEMLQQFNQFKNSFRGDPKQMVMNMLSSGQITNPQLQQAMQMARQFQGFLK